MAVKPSSSASADGKALWGQSPLVRKHYFIFTKKYNIFYTKSILYYYVPCFPVYWEFPLTVFSGTAETSVHHVLS